MERTLVIIKPDGVKRGLIGEVVSRIEKKGLIISDLKMIQADEEILREHYAEHVNKDFFQDLINFMMSGKMIVMVVMGEKAIETVRKINGKTNPIEAEMGSIRGDFAYSVTENIVHGSDSEESAEREIRIWYN